MARVSEEWICSDTTANDALGEEAAATGGKKKGNKKK